MRVLHVIQRYWPAGGGAEHHLHEIGRRLVRDGHSVTVYTTDADDFRLFWDPRQPRLAAPAAERDGVVIRRFAVRHLPAARLTFPAVRRLMAELSRLPLDLTGLLRRAGHFTPWAPGLAAALRAAGPAWDVAAGMTVTFDSLLWPAAEWAAHWGRPWLIYPLTHLGEGPRSAVGRYYTMQHQLALSRRAACVFAQTPSERAFLVAHGVAPERVVEAGVGVNLADYRQGDAARGRARLGVPTDAPLVLHLGTVSRDKGAADTLGALRRLWAAGHPAHFALLGAVQDDVRPALDRLPPTAQARVHALGFVGDTDKHDVLAACDVMCLPSRADSFGIAYLEAWAYGKPVIGARVGGVTDVIADGVDGVLVPFGAPSALADALAALLADPARRQALGAHGRAKAAARYTWDHVYERVRAGYLGAT